MKIEIKSNENQIFSTVSEMRRELARTLSKLNGKSKVVKFSFTATIFSLNEGRE